MPQQFSTGGRIIPGRITKCGSRYLRMLLVEAARIIMMRPHLWPNYSFGSWLAGAVTRMPGNKAAIALASKLARIARSLLRHGTSFDTAENRDMATRAICRPTAIIEFAREKTAWNGLIPPQSLRAHWVFVDLSAAESKARA